MEERKLDKIVESVTSESSILQRIARLQTGDDAQELPSIHPRAGSKIGSDDTMKAVLDSAGRCKVAQPKC
jgi:hypothetical protein